MTKTVYMFPFVKEIEWMRKFWGPQGSVSRLAVESEVLKSNILGDPTSRAVDVYIPAGQDGRGLPLLVDLVGITSSGLSHTNWTAFGENMPERHRPPDRRTTHAAGRGRVSRLLHPDRR